VKVQNDKTQAAMPFDARWPDNAGSLPHPRFAAARRGKWIEFSVLFVGKFALA
jgi:hypothetical protein